MDRSVASRSVLLDLVKFFSEVAALDVEVQQSNMLREDRKRSIDQLSTRLSKNLIENRLKIE